MGVSFVLLLGEAGRGNRTPLSLGKARKPGQETPPLLGEAGSLPKEERVKDLCAETIPDSSEGERTLLDTRERLLERGRWVKEGCWQDLLIHLFILVEGKQRLRNRIRMTKDGQGGDELEMKNEGNHKKVHTGQKPYQSLECEDNVTNGSDSMSHQNPIWNKPYQIHTGQKLYQCLHCEKSFSRKYYLTLHQRSHTEEKPYKCLECGKSFSVKEGCRQDLLIHLFILVEGKQRLRNRIRPRRANPPSSHLGASSPFLSPSASLHLLPVWGEESEIKNKGQHDKIHTVEKPYQDLECGENFSQSSHATSHQRNPIGKKLYPCLECGKSFIHKGFSESSTLTSHLRIHTGEQPYECLECGKSFTWKNSLTSHQRIHKGQKPFQCLESLLFILYFESLLLFRGRWVKEGCWQDLLIHLFILVEGKQRLRNRISCKAVKEGCRQDLLIHLFILVEGKQRLRNRIRIRHLPGEDSELRLSEIFLDRGEESEIKNKGQHDKIHTVEKPYEDLEGGENLSESSHATSHQRNPTGKKPYPWEKPYKCLQCGESFPTSKYFRRHQSIHSGEKPYQCVECGKSFSRKDNLTSHQRIHTGEKPYQCLESEKQIFQVPGPDGLQALQ
ncbi:zinc finger protein 3 homolog [Zootoca vivipara]|uniref:zinc finger protein 3 homolog n=1 Tax=Zootoca vivipara TaxID=8524 RepID=UPI00293B9BD0|nr:zinc finger protein 3 homolog [Zootoca vivipara]